MIPQNKVLMLFVMILVFLSGCIYSSSVPPLAVKEPSERLMCIKNISLFTGDADQEIIENADILIKDGRIERIGKFSMPETDCRIIDGTGKMAIPGLIDHHIHINAPGSPPWFPVLPNQNLVDRNLSAFLYAGITTVFDMGGPSGDLKETKERIEREETLNPRFFYAGKVFTAKGGHPDWMVRELVPWPADAFLIRQIAFLVESRKDIAPAIAQNKALGSSLTKIMVDQIPLGIPSLYEPLVAEIVKESDRAGLIVGSHIGSESDLLTGLNSGVRFFCHAPYRSSVSDSTIAAMKEKQAMIIPTLVVFEYSARFFKGALEFNRLDKQIIDPQILDAYQSIPDGGLDAGDPRLESWIHDLLTYQDIKYENVRKMKKAGIPIIAGSDSPNIATVAGASLHTEMRLLVEKCGFTPTEAVAAATSVSGDMLARTTGVKGLGRIRKGGPADLLILNEDFRDDITGTENIFMVVSNGKIVDRDPRP
ncbi:MAG: amidohydrolase family protein [Desulfobacteraceae bacterium]|jgi:imidazolonepropionase-like amidohydrolase|nr:amidohydrolase family protein [Desulfobacteraceae bacterium]